MNQPHGGMLHDMTSPALTRGPYAKRHMIWPPAGFVEPTLAELDEIRKIVNRRIAYSFVRVKTTPDQWVRELQVIEWFSDRPEVRSNPAYLNYMHELRRWLAAEPNAPVFRSLHRPRCHMCQHTTERTWEATSETHNINKTDGGSWTGFLCARCWSDYLITDEEG